MLPSEAVVGRGVFDLRVIDRFDCGRVGGEEGCCFGDRSVSFLVGLVSSASVSGGVRGVNVGSRLLSEEVTSF